MTVRVVAKTGKNLKRALKKNAVKTLGRKTVKAANRSAKGIKKSI